MKLYIIKSEGLYSGYALTEKNLDKYKNHTIRLPSSDGIKEVKVNELNYKFISDEPNLISKCRELYQLNYFNLIEIDQFIK